MPQWKSENPKSYEDRLSFATYENNFGEIVNDFGSTLFSKPLSVLEATDAADNDTPGEEPDPSSPHMQWQQHFSLNDESLADFMKVIQTESNATSKAYFGVDFVFQPGEGLGAAARIARRRQVVLQHPDQSIRRKSRET